MWPAPAFESASDTSAAAASGAATERVSAVSLNYIDLKARCGRVAVVSQSQFKGREENSVRIERHSTIPTLTNRQEKKNVRICCSEGDAAH